MFQLFQLKLKEQYTKFNIPNKERAEINNLILRIFPYLNTQMNYNIEKWINALIYFTGKFINPLKYSLSYIQKQVQHPSYCIKRELKIIQKIVEKNRQFVFEDRSMV